jgi:hypothetical protein
MGGELINLLLQLFSVGKSLGMHKSADRISILKSSESKYPVCPKKS